MKLKSIAFAAAAVSLVAATPAHAGWKLVEGGQSHEVAKSDLTITPSVDWNRNTSRPIKRSEIWTLEGTTLNEVYFVGGLDEGKTLFKEFDKKGNPLPKMASGMLLTDIPEFYESSTRTALGTSLFEIESVEPTTFAGQPGVKFTFHYGIQNDALIRKGMAMGTMVDGKLFLASYIAPSVYYFDRDLAKAEALMKSARMGG